jgi:Protein of unknown function (DUF2735)
MDQKTLGASAKIYQFPIRQIDVTAGRPDGLELTEPRIAPRVSKVAFGDGWYHDAAILEADTRRNR